LAAFARDDDTTAFCTAGSMKHGRTNLYMLAALKGTAIVAKSNRKKHAWYQRLGRLTLIEWVDSSRLTDGEWLDWADIEPPAPHTCVSVGFMASENGKGVTLVPTIADVEHEDNRHVYGGIVIPRGAIISKRFLG